MTRVHSLVLMGFGVALLVACGKNPQPVTTPTSAPNADSIAAAERARADSAAADSARRAQEEAERIARARADSAAAAGSAMAEVRNMLAAMIHFDFDRASLRSDDQAALDQKVSILQANSAVRIRISGHCDERGSDEYNLALGNRRATAAKQYLVGHGIDAGRIETVSYGEERPIATGHDEESWAQNRRDEFEILSGGDSLKKP
ncbi:MAG TPA: peptidoglycan-associated lipoprotein Pal [Gemmatimonadales bacterium]|jgi:peptidoglycan-associated lipoprotein